MEETVVNNCANLVKFRKLDHTENGEDYSRWYVAKSHFGSSIIYGDIIHHHYLFEETWLRENQQPAIYLLCYSNYLPWQMIYYTCWLLIYLFQGTYIVT